MAFSFTHLNDGQIGGLVVKVFDLNFDGVTEGTFGTGLSNIVYANMNNESSDTDFSVTRNSNDGTLNSSFGDVHVTGVTSGDRGSLIVIGA